MTIKPKKSVRSRFLMLLLLALLLNVIALGLIGSDAALFLNSSRPNALKFVSKIDASESTLETYSANLIPDLEQFEATDLMTSANANQKELESYLSKHGIADKYDVMMIANKEDEFQTLNSWHKTAEFAPASMYKVPLAIVTMHNIEKGEFTLNSSTTMGSRNVDNVMSIMLRESNNDAMTALEKRNGGYERVQATLKELGISVIRRGQKTTAADLAKAFRILIDDNNTFINQQSKDHILNHMFNVIPSQRDRIPTGVDEFKKENSITREIKVANKIGNLDGVWQDGAIIFDGDYKYIMIIMNKNRASANPTQEVRAITKILLKGIIGSDTDSEN
jgi:beta-lactamase class A